MMARQRAFQDRASLSDLREDLYQAHGDQLMKPLVAALRDVWDGAHDAVADRLQENRPNGLTIARRLAQQMDDILVTLLEAITRHVHRNGNPSDSERFALLATGGYGRGAMAPYSDVDFLFVTPYKQTAWGEQIAESLLYALWDMKLKVGHAVRSMDETIKMARQDMTIRTAVLEARFIHGDAGIFDKTMARLETELFAQTGMEFVAAKLDERNKRHQRQGGTRYLVEPNVKEGKGGLRDLHMLFWLAKYIFGTREPKELIHLNLFTKEAFQRFERSRRFLWTVRLHLHLVRGRAEERLTFDIQQEIASRMGFLDRGATRGVERFMKRYFLAAKDVGDLTRIICAALEDNQKKQAPGISRFMPSFMQRKQRPAPGFVLTNGRLNFDLDEPLQASPERIIGIFRLSQTSRYDIHPTALELMSDSLGLVDARLRAHEGANKLFMEILTDQDFAETSLRRMNEAGVLGRFVPDFGKIVAMMQFNMYHHYTADEHLIRAIGILAQIERGELKEEHPLATELFPRIGTRKILYMAMLLHDIAKGRDEDHSIAGERIAYRLCPRLGFTAAETETVAWLVRYHLVMSATAQRRYVGVPKTIRDFVAFVQSPARLRYLLILTVADIRAVGPGVWNGWKGSLLRQLYQEADDVLAGANPVQRRSQRAMLAKDQFQENWAKELANDGDDTAKKFLDMHYDSYWTVMDGDSILSHARLMAERIKTGKDIVFAAEDDGFRGITRFSILTDDHPGLFARITGAVALAGLSVADAKIFTTMDGLALDTLWLQDERGQAIADKARIKRLEKAVLDTLGGHVVLPDVLAVRRKAPSKVDAFKVAPDVVIDQDASGTHTLIEVSGRDRVGLLYDLSRVLVAQNLRISSAQIATFGEKVVDVFYVRDAFGLKVTSQTKLDKISAAMLAVFDGLGQEKVA
ncbi:MAG TPA: [protein-PII] uridylyltransferase [Alphaproteobacteria bacterium]|nr:[protein-PII] uridylyltransferase [Alphaproteobacteria bacterium]